MPHSLRRIKKTNDKRVPSGTRFEYNVIRTFCRDRDEKDHRCRNAVHCRGNVFDAPHTGQNGRVSGAPSSWHCRIL